MTLFVVFYAFLLGLFLLVLDDSELLKLIPFLYLSIFFLVVLTIYKKKDRVLFCFFPSTIMSLYVTFFFFMGTLAFSLQYIQMDIADQWKFYEFDEFGLVSFYFFCAIAATLLAQTLFVQILSSKRLRLFNYKGHIFSQHSIGQGRTNPHRPNQKRYLIFSIIIAVFTIFYDIPLPGGVGSFSSVFFMFAIVHIAYFLKRNCYKYRVLIYILNCGLLGVYFFEDRRLLAFYVFILCFIEFFDRRNLKIKLRNIVLFVSFSFLIVASIIAMSIQRGVGQFDTKSFIKSFMFVDDYLTSDWAVTMLFHNLEGPATTFHSYNAVEHMVQTGDYKFGSTIIKFLFLPFPRSLIAGKPRSMVDEYTTVFYPSFREAGGSFVPNFYAEAFWNFGFVGGLFFITFIFFVLDNFYWFFISKIRGRTRIEDVFFLASFSFLVFLFRGSGFDLFLLFSVIFFVMTYCYRSSDLLYCSKSRYLSLVAPPTEGQGRQSH